MNRVSVVLHCLDSFRDVVFLGGEVLDGMKRVVTRSFLAFSIFAVSRFGDRVVS